MNRRLNGRLPNPLANPSHQMSVKYLWIVNYKHWSHEWQRLQVEHIGLLKLFAYLADVDREERV